MYAYISIPHKINILASLLNKEAQKILSVHFDISYYEYLILLNLASKNPSAINQMFLVRCTGLTKSAISKILKSLVNKKVVEVRGSKKNGRDNAIYITARGQTVVNKATRLLGKTFISFFEGFESKENMQTFSRELDTLIIKLKK